MRGRWAWGKNRRKNKNEEKRKTKNQDDAKTSNGNDRYDNTKKGDNYASEKQWYHYNTNNDDEEWHV